MAAAESVIDDIETIVVVDGDSMKYVNHEKTFQFFGEKSFLVMNVNFSEKRSIFQRKIDFYTIIRMSNLQTGQV